MGGLLMHWPDVSRNGGDPLAGPCRALLAAMIQRARKDAAGKVAGVNDPVKRAAVAREAAEWLAELQNEF